MLELIRVTLDLRPTAKMDPGAAFNHIQNLVEHDGDFSVIGGSARNLIIGDQHCHPRGRSNTPLPVLNSVDLKVNLINRLLSEVRDQKTANPSTIIGHWRAPGSIINAYREGDISFEDAVALLQVKPHA